MAQLKHSFTAQTHPLGPMVIFSYGMTKCGSTLAFEFARTAMELNGYPQPLLSEDLIGDRHRINFLQHITDEDAFDIMAEVKDIGHPIIVKTHTRPDPAVIDLIHSGHAKVHATYRDPREMALSMLDHGKRARAAGKMPFSEYEYLDDTIPNITSQMDSLAQWLYRPKVLPLYYEDLAFHTEQTVRRIMDDLHLPGPTAPVIEHVMNKRFTQKNKAQPRRFRKEMSQDDQSRFNDLFDPFKTHLIRNRHSLPESTNPVLEEGTVLVKKAG